MERDFYYTIDKVLESQYSEKRSKFLAFAVPVQSVDEAMETVESYRKRFYDARHVCWAYVIGQEYEYFRANDDGEPSSTAGKPILGQINSCDLTNIIVLVVRYFGGIKLGTSGLIVAYKTAAAEALAQGKPKLCTIDSMCSIRFDYPLTNQIMRIIDEEQAQIVEQIFEIDCYMKLKIRNSKYAGLRDKLTKYHTLVLKDL